MDPGVFPPALGEPRTATGRLFGRLLFFIDKYRLRERVLERVAPETVRLMVEPPGPFEWVHSAPFEDLYMALEAVGGDALNFKLGLEMSRTLGGSIVAPVLQAAFAMSGAKLTTAFKCCNGAYGLMSRGITFQFAEVSPTEGLVFARFEAPLPSHAIMIVVQGTIQWAFELLDLDGTVGPPEIRSESPESTVAAYEIFAVQPMD
jgi:hypothetical protein